MSQQPTLGSWDKGQIWSLDLFVVCVGFAFCLGKFNP
jgi:hypothetical protein